MAYLGSQRRRSGRLLSGVDLPHSATVTSAVGSHGSRRPVLKVVWPRRLPSSMTRFDPNRSSHSIYWITSSAVASSVSGTMRPKALAVSRLMESCTFVTCCTGRSAGFSPLKMRPA
jgi:hypothetical protein